MYMLVAVVVLCAGAGMAVQMPITAVVASRWSLPGSLVLINASGLAAVIVALLLRGKPFLSGVGHLPWYAYVAGPLGMVVMGSIAFAIPRIGICSTLVLSIAAQLCVGVLLDHVGFLGLTSRVLDVRAAVGAGLVILGAWLVAG